MAKGGINLNVQVNSAVAALRALDGMMKKLDQTMSGMKGMPPDVTRRFAELEAQLTSLSGQEAHMKGVASGEKRIGKKRGAKKRAKEAVGGFQDDIIKANVEYEALTEAINKYAAALEKAERIQKESDAATKSGMKEVQRYTSAKNEQSRAELDSIKQKRNLGIPLTEKEQVRVRELNSHVRDASRGRRELTAEERRLASALGFTGKRLNIQSGVLKKNQNALEKLRLTVARTRNITLLYAFAVRPMQKLLESVTKEFSEYEKAMLGASRVAQRMNVSQAQLSGTIQKFTGTGMLDATEVSQALKTLLSTGIGLPKATELLSAMADAAAFNRQGTLELGQALTGATQGFKNMNSRMVDNAGITKNLNVILKEQAHAMGRQVKDLTEMEKKMAIANGLIKEASMFQGDLGRATLTTSGAFAKGELEMAKFNRQVGKAAERHGLLYKFAEATQEIGIALQQAFMTPLEQVQDAITRADTMTTELLEKFAKFQMREALMDASKTFGQDMLRLQAQLSRNADRLFAETARQRAAEAALANPGQYGMVGTGSRLPFGEYASLAFGSKDSPLELDLFGSDEEMRAQLENLQAMLKEYQNTSEIHLQEVTDRLAQASTILFDTDWAKKQKEALAEHAQDVERRRIEGQNVVGPTIRREETEIRRARARAEIEVKKLKDELQALTVETVEGERALQLIIARFEKLVPAVQEAKKALGDEPKFTPEQFSEYEKLLEKLRRQQDQYGEHGIFSAPAKAIKALEKDLQAIIRTIEKELPAADDRVKALRKGFEDIYAQRQTATVTDTIRDIDMATAILPTDQDISEHKRINAVNEVTKAYTKHYDVLSELAVMEGITTEEKANLEKMIAELKIREAKQTRSVLDKINRTEREQMEKDFAYVSKLEIGKVAMLKAKQKEISDRYKQNRRDHLMTDIEYYQAMKDLQKFTADEIAAYEDKLRQQKRDERNKEINETIAHLSKFAGSMTKIMRGMDRMSETAARNAAAIVASAGRAAAAMQALQKAQQMGSTLGQISAIASMVATGVELVSTLTDKDDETQERKERERRRRFGATINRGPQTLYLTPTLVLNVDGGGDVHFGEDSLEVVHQRQLAMLQESVDFGEIAMPTEETMR